MIVSRNKLSAISYSLSHRDYDTDTFKMVSQQDADTVRSVLKLNLTFLDTNWIISFNSGALSPDDGSEYHLLRNNS